MKEISERMKTVFVLIVCGVGIVSTVVTILKVLSTLQTLR